MAQVALEAPRAAADQETRTIAADGSVSVTLVVIAVAVIAEVVVAVMVEEAVVVINQCNSGKST
jgi:hypothetical protein